MKIMYHTSPSIILLEFHARVDIIADFVAPLLRTSSFDLYTSTGIPHLQTSTLKRVAYCLSFESVREVLLLFLVFSGAGGAEVI